LRDAPGFHLIPEMNPLPSEAIFDKITMSAFEGAAGHCVTRLRHQCLRHRRHRDGNRH